MNKSVVLIFILLTTIGQLAYGQRIPSAFWSGIGISDTVHLDLTNEQRHYIRMLHIQHHLNYLEYYYGDDDKNRRTPKVCRKLQRGYVDYEEVFEFPYFRPASIPDSAYMQFDSLFIIWPYRSLIYDTDSSVQIPNILIKDYAPAYERNYRELSIKLYGPDSTMHSYILCWIYEHLYKTRSLVAINKSDYRDVLFLSGNVRPLSYLPLEISAQLYHPDRLARMSLNKQNLIQHMVNIGIEDTKENYEQMLGLMEYAHIIGRSIFATAELSQFPVSYNNGTYVVQVQMVYGCNKVPCKSLIPDNLNNWPLQNYLGMMLHMPNSFCSDYKRRAVCIVYVRINPSIRRVELKIEEMYDMRKLPECIEVNR